MRCAAGAGADAVVIARRRNAPLSATARKAASGAAEHLPLVSVTNIASGLERISEAGLAVIGAAAGRRAVALRHGSPGTARRRARWRGAWPAPAHPRTVRPDRLDSPSRPRGESERLGGGRRVPLRGRTPALRRTAYRRRRVADHGALMRSRRNAGFVGPCPTDATPRDSSSRQAPGRWRIHPDRASGAPKRRRSRTVKRCPGALAGLAVPGMPPLKGPREFPTIRRRSVVAAGTDSVISLPHRPGVLGRQTRKERSMRHYEVVFMVHPDQSEQVSAMVERYRSMIESDGGSLHRLEDWGRRQLAYPISKIHKAHYVLMNVECTNGAPCRVDERLQVQRRGDPPPHPPTGVGADRAVAPREVEGEGREGRARRPRPAPRGERRAIDVGTGGGRPPREAGGEAFRGIGGNSAPGRRSRPVRPRSRRPRRRRNSGSCGLRARAGPANGGRASWPVSFAGGATAALPWRG